MLSPAQIVAREGRLTASRIACLMTGDAEKILDLWRELTGDPSYVQEDLSGIWAVQLGSHTEVLNLDWYERRIGKPLSRRGEVVVHGLCDWAACTLDAWDIDLSAPVECKHVGGFEKMEAVIARYMPQIHWQMIVTGASKGVFSIIEGAREPVIEVIERSDEYAAELWSRAERFMQYVFDLTPPVATAPVVAPPVVKVQKLYDMTGKNDWASEAVTWITTKQSAKDYAASDKALKALVPADAAKCSGHGIIASRNKAGSLSIREAKE